MEGALDWALPQQGGGGSEGPQVVPRSLPDLESIPPCPPTSPPHNTTHTHTHSPGVAMLGSLPGPEGGISWGWLILCPSQTEELQ